MNVSSSELLSQDPYTTIINAGEHPGKREIRGAVRYRPGDLLEAEHLAFVYEGTLAAYEQAGGATQDASVEQVVPPSQPDEVSFLDRRL
jgi:hypothetical protein